MNSLRLASRQRARLTLEGEVTEAHFGEIADAILQFAQHVRASLSHGAVSPNAFDPCRDLVHRQLADVGDRRTIDAHVQGVALELAALAERAHHEAAIFRE